MDYRKLIKDFFIEKDKAEGLEYDTDLFEGGYVDSLFALEIVVYLEDCFSLRIKNKDITEDNFRSIDRMAELVERLKTK